MNISEPSIKRPVMTFLLMISIFFFGIFAYQNLPVSDLPNVDLPAISVSVDYPGASPETMANAVATPLEQQFMTIEGIQSVFSSSSTGSTSITLLFDVQRNIDSASTDVQAAISRAQPNLPSNLPNQPTYQKANPAAIPILYYVIRSENMELSELYDFASTIIGKRISMIEGVSQVLTFGSPYAVRVQVDPEKLAGMDLGLDEVTRSIQMANVDLPVGTLYGKRDDFTIDVDGQLLKAPGYNEIIIKNADGNLVKIKDIGRALNSVANDKFTQTYVTKNKTVPCIILGVQRSPSMNTVEITDKITELLKILKPQLPGSLEITTTYSQAESIKEGVFDVEMTLIIAFVLVVLLVYLFLGKWLDTIIPSISLPLTVLGTFAIMYLLGFSINILTLLSITLSIGFLIDDAIVVLENNVRHVEMGDTPYDAAIHGSKEISMTVLSITLSLVAAFFPLLFMPGVVGNLFREFAATITVAILFSGFISLTLVPMLCSKFIPPKQEAKKGRIARFADLWNHKLKNIYEPLLHLAMKHRIIVLATGLGCIVGSIFLFKTLPVDFLPNDDTGFLKAYTVARDGTSPDLMEEYHKKVNELAMQTEDVESIFSVSSSPTPNQGFLFFRLKPFRARKPMNEVINELSAKFKQLPGVNVYVSPLPLINLQVGTTAQALYQYSLTSIDQKKLYEYAPKLVEKMKKQSDFSQVSSDLRDNQPQWKLHILRDKASNYNVSASAIESYFQYAYSNNKISQINGTINQYDVLIETLPQFYRSPEVLSKLYVSSNSGDQVPLSELVEVKESVGPLTINHIDSLTSVNISFNPGENVPLGDAINEIESLASIDKPSEIYGKVIGTADIFKSSFENLDVLLLISFFVIYVILGILYESFIHPITVMSTLPTTLLGGLLTLRLFNQTLSIYSFVGLILLVGIVLKNGILVVDFALKAEKEEGKSSYDSVIEACLIRFRPIIMTTFAAMMGAVPIATGIGGGIAKTRVSLGLCIVGGLMISQLITLFLTPVVYYYFDILQQKVKKRFIKNKELS